MKRMVVRRRTSALLLSSRCSNSCYYCTFFCALLLILVQRPTLFVTQTWAAPSLQHEDEQTKKVTVHLPEFGRVLGRRSHGVDFFGGLPYAAPPVGHLRWAPPEPATPWAPSKLDATQFGPDCWQLVDAVGNPGAALQHMSEDCLHLNVFTSAGASSSMGHHNLQPVMVWLHGGAFQQGGARRDEYDGRRLAERGVVVVTLNYRLGALGFLVSSSDGLLGNWGLMDQRAALHWVKDNIRHFGGDPDNITLFGESAGAVMTLLHLMMEGELESGSGPYDSRDRGRYYQHQSHQRRRYQQQQSRSNDRNNKKKNRQTTKQQQRLIHKVIIQSNPLGLQFRSVVIADFIGEALKRSVDCRDLACLRAERVEEIMRAQSSLMGVPRSVGDFFTWGPTLTQELQLTLGTPSSSSSQSPLRRDHHGGGLFRDLDSWRWQASVRENAWAAVNVTQPLKYLDLIPDDIPVIIGANKHEGEMFVHGAFPITMTKAVYWMFVGALFRDSASRVLKHYRGYVDQIEAEAQELARKQIEEEENRQFYLENQEDLDREYQYLLQMNLSSTGASGGNGGGGTRQEEVTTGYEALVETWSRGGSAPAVPGNSTDSGKSKRPWHRRLLPFVQDTVHPEEGTIQSKDFVEAARVEEETETTVAESRSSNNVDFRPWHQRLWPFNGDGDDPEELAEKQRIREEKKKIRAKERALKEAAKVVVDYRPVMSRIIDDYLFRCPAWHLAHRLSRNRLDRGETNNVFVYQFSHSTHIPGYPECWGKACHTAELPFVFQAMDVIRSNYSTLGPYAQQEAPKPPEYPYSDILAAYRDAMEAADRDEMEEATAFSWGENITSTRHSKGFQRLLGSFFGDYFKEDADEEIASDMADRWVSFAKTGDPNYDSSKARWRPWRYLFDGESEVDDVRLFQPEDFDDIFDDSHIDLESYYGSSSNDTVIEGNFWSDDPEERNYRRRALIALGMEVVEEDVFQTMLRRIKFGEETDNPFHNFLLRIAASSTSNTRKGGKEDMHLRRAIRQLQRIAQDMGFIGTGLRDDPRRRDAPVSAYWEDAFFPEILELKWPPEGRLVERDCTCDLWDRIRYRY